MEEIAVRAMLFDFYGPLLTPKQQIIYDLYYQQDFSLGEIAEQQNVSRQAVYDLLKRTDESLRDYEKKLNLIKRQEQNQALIQAIKEKVTKITDEIITKNCNTKDSADIDSKKIFGLLEKLENNW